MSHGKTEGTVTIIPILEMLRKGSEMHERGTELLRSNFLKDTRTENLLTTSGRHVPQLEEDLHFMCLITYRQGQC